MPKSLKLVGPKTYHMKMFSRPLKRGEVVEDVPDDVADKLLTKGVGDPESDDFKPYFREVAVSKKSRKADADADADTGTGGADNGGAEGQQPKPARKAPQRQRRAAGE